ncbi:hypothetical protein PR048_000526 [Dryococelus australis]|uniref:Uncharacterized protein n=1 Tax=Dryococelus australis TaxID=614101 RepID=A0ABQ9IF03_9NEOP|nr:hypothetical protein PR048_000526 [Dryococelus australis]
MFCHNFCRDIPGRWVKLRSWTRIDYRNVVPIPTPLWGTPVDVAPAEIVVCSICGQYCSEVFIDGLITDIFKIDKPNAEEIILQMPSGKVRIDGKVPIIHKKISDLQKIVHRVPDKYIDLYLYLTLAQPSTSDDNKTNTAFQNGMASGLDHVTVKCHRSCIWQPPRSPDLNPLDCNFWGHLKALVYTAPVGDVGCLPFIIRIVVGWETIRNFPRIHQRILVSMQRQRFERLLTARSREPMRVIEVSVERRRNERAGETGDSREKPSYQRYRPARFTLGTYKRILCAEASRWCLKSTLLASHVGGPGFECRRCRPDIWTRGNVVDVAVGGRAFRSYPVFPCSSILPLPHHATPSYVVQWETFGFASGEPGFEYRTDRTNNSFDAKTSLNLQPEWEAIQKTG